MNGAHFAADRLAKESLLRNVERRKTDERVRIEVECSTPELSHQSQTRRRSHLFPIPYI